MIRYPDLVVFFFCTFNITKVLKQQTASLFLETIVYGHGHHEKINNKHSVITMSGLFLEKMKG